jgi:membrane protease YdiL (CAAX protease family)
MKTRVIQSDRDDERPTTGDVTPGRSVRAWVARHRLSTFFVLAYALSWWPWALYGAGVWPAETFIPAGPLVAAVVVVAVAEGRAGLRDLGARIVRWRVPWYWYAVALGLPLAVRFGTALVNAGPGGAPMPSWPELAWTSFLLAFLVRLVNPMDGPMGEEPGWRGYAVPRLQATRSPLVSAAVLGVLVAGWHLPLVFFGDLGAIGLLTTFVITIVYVWLFNRTGGSVLLTLVMHSTQGAVKAGDLGFVGADLARQEVLECVAWSAVAVGLVALDRAAWRRAPASAVVPAGAGRPAQARRTTARPAAA